MHASSFDEVQKHERERCLLAAEVKKAREAAKSERQQLKQHATESSNASTWTARLLEQDDAHFDRADEGIERELTQATTGLVSAAAFRETKERLEKRKAEQAVEEAAQKAEKEAEARRKRLRKKQEKRQQEAAKLSFDDDDGVEGGGETGDG